VVLQSAVEHYATLSIFIESTSAGSVSQHWTSCSGHGAWFALSKTITMRRHRWLCVSRSSRIRQARRRACVTLVALRYGTSSPLLCSVHQQGNKNPGNDPIIDCQCQQPHVSMLLVLVQAMLHGVGAAQPVCVGQLCWRGIAKASLTTLTCRWNEWISQVKFYTQQGNWDMVGNNIPV